MSNELSTIMCCAYGMVDRVRVVPKVDELFRDLPAKAKAQAANHKNDTTGL